MPLTKKRISLLVALALGTSVSSFAQITWPTITTQTKPWSRWWWEGSAVNKKDLTWNMETYQKAGIGGLEVTPIYGVKGHESEFIQFLSPQWMDVFGHTLSEAKRLNMGIDLANATGWPFGGPWVSNDDASKEMFWKTFEVKGGGTLADSVTFVQQPLLRVDGQAVPIETLKDPVSSNKNLQLMAIDQIRYKKPIPLQVLMAYNDKGQALDLTSKVGSDGKLNWTAPEGGSWQLYAIFQGWHGKMVERAAPGGEGYAIDHFSAPALQHYLARFDEAFKGKNLSNLRGYFNDSYEVDDARGQANFTPHLFDEFKKRRGYDLRNYLPALFGKSDEQTNKRVLSDYRETISDLVLDNFTTKWHDWGKSQGKLIRNQSHGSPSNILDLYAAIDIPETEGTDILRFKFATSAAHVNGKPLASSESATWLNDHFLSSLGDVKQAIDNYFVGGVNHIFYHGIEYSPKNAPWPGWLFYAAVHFQPTNPFWKDFSTLNTYIANVQSFLQQGKPDDDVLVYYPIYDTFAEHGRDLLKHYDAMRPEFTGSPFEEVSNKMLQRGYTFDFISDKQIGKLQTEGSSILTGGIKYKTILLPDNKVISVATLQKLVDLAKAGANVVVYKHLPEDINGMSDLSTRQNKFKALLGELSFGDAGDGLKVSRIGKGAVWMGDDLEKLLSAAKVSREQMTDENLLFNRREIAGNTVYFIANKGKSEVDKWVPITAKASSVVFYNAMLHQAGLAKVRQQNGRTEVHLQLKAGESAILKASPKAVTGNTYAYYKEAGNAVDIKGNWTVKFLEGGPKIPATVQTKDLKSWTDFDGDDYKTFSGTASYNIQFAKPKGNAAMWQLKMEKVYENAEVYLNGVKVAVLLGPDYSVNIPAKLLKPTNQLEIRVANLMANRIIDMDKKNIPYRIFYNTNFQAHFKENRGADGLFTAANWSPKPSGIEGKVTLTPLKAF